MTNQVNPRRVRYLNQIPLRSDGACVLFWMSRDQRVEDNWALLYAQEQSRALQRPLRVVFALTPGARHRYARHYAFMLGGLAQVERDLRRLNIPFEVRHGAPAEAVVQVAREYQAALVVTDFSPLRGGRAWRERAATDLACPLVEVDTHNVIPAWQVSTKEEFGAHTLRPKVHRLLPDYLTPIPPPDIQPRGFPLPPPINWDVVWSRLQPDPQVASVQAFVPGSEAGLAVLRRFLTERLARYSTARNDPLSPGQSGLSPYLHYGQVSPQRAALEASRYRDQAPEDVAAFLEELIVRRELAENYCFYQPHYDCVTGARDWARRTLDDHRADPRPHLYTAQQLEQAQTHDPAWNAAQIEMVRHGKMHNYMRMYWAKKILEWTPSPEAAYEIAIALNDRYELDGRDPNGYTNIAWSLGGVHDRPWPERPIFGKIRSMVAGGLARKFDVQAYIRANPPL